MSLFFRLQRRLREAVQLLEDYKHGTLRPGVTNEQVTLLQVGEEGRWQIHNPFHVARPFFPFSIHFYCGYRPCGLLPFGGDTHTLGLMGSMKAGEAREAQRQ